MRILLVDDDPALLTLISKLLPRELSTASIDTATNAADAQAAIEERSFDCVVSDYDMPRTNGIELLENVRETHPELPFILLTGKGSEEIAIEAIEAGVTSYFRKSGDRSQYRALANQIENAVAKYHAERDLETRVQQQQAVAELGEMALGDCGLQELFDSACRSVASVLDTEYSKVLQFRPATDDLLLRAGVGWNDALVGSATVGANDASQAGCTLRSRDAVIVDDLEAETRFSGPNLLTDHGIVSGISVIIGPVDDPWGILGTHSTARQNVTEKDVTFVQNVANVLAEAITRHETNRRLETSERRYRTLAENVPNGAVFLFDGGLRHVLARGQLLHEDGYLSGDIEGTHVRDAFPTVVSDRLEPHYEAALKGDHREFELSVHGRRYSVHTLPVSTADSDFGMAMIRDVTERERDKQQLETLIDNLPGIVYQCRNESARPLELVAGDCESITGYAAAELGADVGSFDELIHSDDRARVRNEIGDALAGGGPFEFTYRIRTKAGGVRWIWERGREVDSFDTDGALLEGYVMDITDHKRRERGLSTLHSATQKMMAAETKDDVCRIATTAAETILGLDLIGIYLFEPESYELRPVSYTDDVSEAFETIPTFARGEGLIWDVFVDDGFHVYDDIREESTPYNPDTNIRSEILASLGNHGALICGSVEPGISEEIDAILLRILCKNITEALTRADREETLRDREEQVSRKNAELKTVNNINTLTRTVVKAISRADSRRTIEQSVCETLASIDPYCFAWIGRYDFVDDELVPAAHAGINRSSLETVPVSNADGVASPAVEAVIHQQLATRTELLADRSRTELHRDALRNGYQGIAAVPLVTDGRVLGVLNLYSDRSNAFTEQELDVLAELGEIIGYAINVAEKEEAYHSDGRIELTFSTTDRNLVHVWLSEELACRVEQQGIVTGDDGSMRLFVSIDGATEAEIRAVLDDNNGGSLARVLSEHDGTVLVELIVRDPLLAGLLAHYGGTIASVSAESGTARATVQLPQSVNVRTMIDRTREKYPDIELVARRDVERPAETPIDLAGTIEAALTDRQYEILQAAYFSGYFNNPRDTNGTDIAAVFDINQSTFHEHIRAAQRRVFAAILERTE